MFDKDFIVPEAGQDGTGAIEEPAAAPVGNAPEETAEIVGVRFREGGKVYFFAPGANRVSPGDPVIVETARGVEFGYASSGIESVPVSKIVPPLRPLLRTAGKKDVERWEANRALEDEAFEICRKKIEDHRLGMKLIRAEYTFDNSKLFFYYSAEARVDFRELLKDLGSVFHTRIELRQIGIRDEAKMLGGLGVCGRPFCCATFLSDFAQVSIKMAKEQNLSLNSQKISGACGRLMCCLRYEHETYEAEIARTPPVDSTVKTPDGIGQVTEISPLTGFVKVRIREDVKAYHRDDLTVLRLKGDKKPLRGE
ncbi:MAG: stage 0 sporulation family protein [Clostridia bacterium]|nr:stage 0 sporulation family protein [Clostridia bacterium]